jgi:hypothetical protein
MKNPHLRLVLLPLLLVASALAYSTLKGPYWKSGESDPEYAYLLNALSVAELVPPAMVEHPGTTVECLGAALIRVKHAFSTGSTAERGMVQDVLTRPESFLAFIRTVLTLLNGLALFLVGWIAYRFTKDLRIALPLQLAPFLSTAAFASMGKVSPEPVIFFVTQCIVALLVGYVFSEEVDDRRFGKLGGIACGLGMATKITFAPVCSIAFLPSKGRDRLRFIFTSIVAFLVALAPALPSHRKMSTFWQRVVVHRGNYGQGERGLTPIGTLAENFVELVRQDFVFIVVLILSAVTLLLLKKSSAVLGGRERRMRSVFSLLSATLLIHVVLASKASEARYLLPSTAMSALLLVLSFRLWPVNAFHRIGRWAALAIAVVLVGNTARFAYQTVSHIRDRYEESDEQARLLKNRYPTCTVADYYVSDSPEYALYFGDSWALHRYAGALVTTYPNQLFYGLRDGNFYDFRNVVMDREALKTRPCLILRGTPFTGARAELLPKFPMETLFEGKITALYLVRF